LRAVADLKKGLTMEVDMPEPITGFWIRSCTDLGWGARRRRLPTPTLMDEEHPRQSFTYTDGEELPAIELNAPATGGRRRAEKMSSVKKHPSRRSACCSSARRPDTSRYPQQRKLSPFLSSPPWPGREKERAAALQSRQCRPETPSTPQKPLQLLSPPPWPPDDAQLPP
jgi:hypothetical protein